MSPRWHGCRRPGEHRRGEIACRYRRGASHAGTIRLDPSRGSRYIAPMIIRVLTATVSDRSSPRLHELMRQQLPILRAVRRTRLREARSATHRTRGGGRPVRGVARRRGDVRMDGPPHRTPASPARCRGPDHASCASPTTKLSTSTHRSKGCRSRPCRSGAGPRRRTPRPGRVAPIARRR